MEDKKHVKTIVPIIETSQSHIVLDVHILYCTVLHRHVIQLTWQSRSAASKEISGTFADCASYEAEAAAIGGKPVVRVTCPARKYDCTLPGVVAGMQYQVHMISPPPLPPRPGPYCCPCECALVAAVFNSCVLTVCSSHASMRHCDHGVLVCTCMFLKYVKSHMPTHMLLQQWQVAQEYGVSIMMTTPTWMCLFTRQ